MTEAEFQRIELAIQNHYNDDELRLHRPKNIERFHMTGNLTGWVSKSDGWSIDGYVVRVNLDSMQITEINVVHEEGL